MVVMLILVIVMSWEMAYVRIYWRVSGGDVVSEGEVKE